VQLLDKTIAAIEANTATPSLVTIRDFTTSLSAGGTHSRR